MSAEPAVERLRTAVNNMNDVEGGFLTVLRDESRKDEVGKWAQRCAHARAEFAAAMDDLAGATYSVPHDTCNGQGGLIERYVTPWTPVDGGQ